MSQTSNKFEGYASLT